MSVFDVLLVLAVMIRVILAVIFVGGNYNVSRNYDTYWVSRQHVTYWVTCYRLSLGGECVSELNILTLATNSQLFLLDNLLDIYSIKSMTL